MKPPPAPAPDGGPRPPASLRLRLTWWFTGSLVVIILVLTGVTYLHLKHELKEESWERGNRDAGTWVLHGSYAEDEIQDILGELVGFVASIGIPLVLVALGVGYFLAARSARPARFLNQQLAGIGIANLDRRVDPAATDREYVELASHVNALLARLERSFADYREHSTRVAHELRTPLHILRLRLEKAAPHLDPDFSDSMDQELARLATLVDGLLTTARAEHHQLPVHPLPQPVAPLLEDFLETYRLLAAESGRTMALHSQVGPKATVFADPGHLKQILHNLLDNALKHGNGLIGIRIAPLAGDRLSLTVSNQRRTVGPPASPGTGLGLRLVQALARLQPDGSFRLHAGRSWFAARLVLRRG